MEALDWDDLGFYPCSCGYQICRFCWHRLRTDENGLCPACRQAFPDIPVSFNPEISAEELKKQKRRNKEKKSNKDQVFKPQDLATLRVVQKNLVFVIGLSSRLTQEDLKKEFAHFGKIIKFVHNKSTAYITYSKPEEAIRAIRTLNASAAQENIAAQQQQSFQINPHLTLNGTTTTTTQSNTTPATNGITTTTASTNATTITTTSTNNNNVVNLNNNNINSFINAISAPSAAPANRLKASLGTTKYCNHFLRSQQCPKVGECMYLHEIAEAEASFTKEQMQAGKHVEYEKKLMDSYLSSSTVLQPQPVLLLRQQQQLQQFQIPQQLQQQQPQINSTIQTAPQIHLHQHQQLLQPQLQAQLQQPIQHTSQQLKQHHHHHHQQQQQLQHQNQLRHLLQPPSPQELHQLIHPQQQPPQQPTSPQVMDDSDSEDDGLDFDPISVSTSALRDLLDQQVQQAKQMQMQNYIQQMSSNPTLTSVLFQQNNRLLQHHHHHQPASPTNRLLLDAAATFNGRPATIASLAAGLTATNNVNGNQPEQMAWPSLGTWTNFLQRSGFGFENGR